MQSPKKPWATGRAMALTGDGFNIDGSPGLATLSTMSGDSRRCSAPAVPGPPHLHRRHRRRRFRIRPEALGLGAETYTPVLVLTSTVAASAEPAGASAEPQGPEGPEAKALSERSIAHRSARKGIRVCLEVLLVALLCIYYREIWRWYLSAALAWPDWAHDWRLAGFDPF